MTEEQKLLIDHVARADQPIKVRREPETLLNQFVGRVGVATQTALQPWSGCSAFSVR